MRLLPATTLLLVACQTAPGVAHVLNGATVQESRAVAAAPGAAADGTWWVSPDRVEVDFLRVGFEDEVRNQRWDDLSDCSATYDRAEPTLSERLNCTFEVPAGTYASVDLEYDPTMLVTIDDPANGLYTDGQSVVTTEPEGGAVASPITSWQSGTRSLLNAPLVVTDEPIELQVVMSGVHTLQVEVSGGVATPMTSFVVHIYATAGDLGAAAYLSNEGTGLSVNRTDNGTPGELLLFYQDLATPSYAFLKPSGEFRECGPEGSGSYEAYNVSPGYRDESGQTPGGYLAVDGAGDLCFALPTDGSWRESQAIYRMHHPTDIGEATTLECEATNSAPAPVSGDTYASGCPELNVAGQDTMFLVAR
jgi:hypothetical protein